MSEEMNVANVNEVEATGTASESQDLTFKCAKCGEEFTITAGENNWYKSKGFELPKICANCRKERKADKKAGKKNKQPTTGSKQEHIKKEFEPAEVKDTEMTCTDCGKTFTITTSGVEWYNSKKFFLPHKCSDCRAAKKKQSKKSNADKPVIRDDETSVGAALRIAMEKAGITAEDLGQNKETV